MLSCWQETQNKCIDIDSKAQIIDVGFMTLIDSERQRIQDSEGKRERTRLSAN